MTIVKDQKKGQFFFSEHGSKQLHVRSKLSHTDVFLLLQKGLYVPVGQDKHRVHVVIHSVIDNIPLVVVFDERNKEIITVLYLEYNNNFVISPQVADDIREKTVREEIQRWETRTEWIDLFACLKHKEVFEPVKMCFQVVVDGEMKDIHFYTIQADYISNNIKNINQIPNLKKIIEKARSRLKIGVSSIAQITVTTSMDLVIKIAKPHRSAISLTAAKKIQKQLDVKKESSWFRFLIQLRNNKVTSPAELCVFVTDGHVVQEHMFHIIQPEEIEHSFNKIREIPNLRNMIESFCNEHDIKRETILGFFAKSSPMKPVKFAESQDYARVVSAKDLQRQESLLSD